MGDRPQTPAGQWLDDAPDPGHKALRRALDENVGEGATADSAIARQRIWSRVQAPWASEDGRGRRWAVPLLAAAAGGAAVALAVLVVPGGPWRRAPVAALPPPAPTAPAGPRVVPLPSPPAALSTRAGERTRHRLARGVAVELAPATALLPGDEAAAPEVTVGEVRFSVPHQGAGGRRYTVRAGDYTVAVLGTTFVVAVDGAAVNVAVETGVVEVEETATGRLLDRLERGERWSSVPEAAAEPPVEVPAAATAPARPAPTRRAGATRPAVVRTPIVSDPASASLLLEAAEARRAGNSRRALALYEQVVATGSSGAELSLYTVAEILDRDLSELRQALATWERHRARYPRSPFRADTDLSIVDVLSRLGEDRRTLDEAQEFLRRHPGNERRGEVAVIAAHLERQRGSWAAALRLYETALRERLSAADADDAVFHRAACLAALGDRRAPEALRGYVARYPAGRHAAEARRLAEPRARTTGER